MKGEYVSPYTPGFWGEDMKNVHYFYRGLKPISTINESCAYLTDGKYFWKLRLSPLIVPLFENCITLLSCIPKHLFLAIKME